MTQEAGEYALIDEFYLLPTTGGAFYAVSRPDDTPMRRLILALLRYRASPRATIESLCGWLGVDDEQLALQLVYRAQTLAWIEGYEHARDIADVGVGEKLHELLPHLSSAGKSLIVDWNGLTLASSGVDGETADALSALSADLISVQERHADRLADHFGLATHGWAAVDAFGASRIGAWPLYVGDERLMLVLVGEPQLNRPEFLTLVWLLISRYG